MEVLGLESWRQAEVISEGVQFSSIPKGEKSQFSKYILIYISSRFDVAYQEFQRQIDRFNDVFELDILFIQFISWNFKVSLR